MRPMRSQFRSRRRRALVALGLALALLGGLAGLPGRAVAATVPAPSDVTATPAGDSAIDLTWAAPTAPSGFTLLGYDLYQGLSPGGESGTPVNSAALLTSASYSATDLRNETTYYYDVIAIYQGSDEGDVPSPPSSQASATTGPVAPVSPTAPASSTPSTPAASATTASVSSSVTPSSPTATASAGSSVTPSSPTVPAGAGSGGGVPTAGTTPTASTGPGRLAVILLAVAVALLAGILVLLAVRLWGARRRPPAQPPSHPPTPQAARIKAEPQPGPPPTTHVRVTGTQAAHTVRIEPRPGPQSTTIEEVRS